MFLYEKNNKIMVGEGPNPSESDNYYPNSEQVEEMIEEHGGGGATPVIIEVESREGSLYPITDKTIIREAVESGTPVLLKIPSVNSGDRYFHLCYFKDWEDESDDFELTFFAYDVDTTSMYSYVYYSDDQPLDGGEI